MKELEIKSMYSLDHTLAAPMLEGLTYPWEALPMIKDWILEIGKTLSEDEYDQVAENVWIHKTAKVFESIYSRTYNNRC